MSHRTIEDEVIVLVIPLNTRPKSTERAFHAQNWQIQKLNANSKPSVVSIVSSRFNMVIHWGDHYVEQFTNSCSREQGSAWVVISLPRHAALLLH
jgi:hypothetical protein